MQAQEQEEPGGGEGAAAALLDAPAFKPRLALLLTALKLLLIPCYRSTDFEVHRNWLAITASLPLLQWYTDATSEWTLDYPPLFAWFEWALAQAARLADPAMLQVDNLDYASPATIYFQRGSVILTDLVLASGAWYATRRLSKRHSNLVYFLIVASPGLLIVDHIHFQYNGFLLGVLLWSLGCALEGRDLASGLLLAALLNLKHLFLPLAPIYFVYLLRHHCRAERALLNFCRLGAGVAGVFALSFGPFVARGQLQQVLSRLFPFGRGLTHSYWAANAWALYAALDKALVLGLRLAGGPVEAGAANLTGGLVGSTRFALLPSVPPAVPAALLLLALLPPLLALWRAPRPVVLTRAVAYACLSSFMLGYHVHEKAVLTAIVPAALSAVASRRSAGRFLFLSSVGTYALFPLLFTPAEYPIKVLLLLSYTAVAWAMLRSSVPARNPAKREALLGSAERAFLAGLAAVELYASWLHPRLLGERLPFLPLMLVSVYSAGGMAWAWAQPDALEVQLFKRD